MQPKRRIVILGGGFAGATAARALAQAGHQVTMIEAEAQYVSCPFSNPVLAGLRALLDVGRPLAVGVSRKSFVGAITGRGATGDRLAGSLAATAAAVLNGAALIRTHDVAATLDAVRVAERIRDA